VQVVVRDLRSAGGSAVSKDPATPHHPAKVPGTTLRPC
jgi:hypothetical protein